VPPAPRCLPNATRRGGIRPQEPPPHPDQRLDQSPGAHPRQGRCECCGAHEHQRALEVDLMITKQRRTWCALHLQ
jgi:hypothetical protein